MSIRKGNDIIASTPAVDTVPQQGSANVITSGGVYTALQDYVTLSTPQTITANKAFNGAKISTDSNIEFTSVVAGLVSNRNGTIRNLITRTNFNEVNVGNPYDPTVILGSGVRPHYNTIEFLALYSDIPGDFTGATSVDSGTNGLVPAPAAGDQGKFLQGDGSWATPTTATAWGNITGTLSSQTDLQNALDSKANTDMNNLTSTGANIGNWSHNVTNCITEIPQDIKLELNNGTLTLKAGSKVYVPNGVGVFDEVTVANDVSVTWNTNTQGMLIYRPSDNNFSIMPVSQTSSGNSAPTVVTVYWCWYDTSSNIVKTTADNGSTWDTGWALPIGIITANSSQITDINRVFNGVGYIGSTVFALPGVKGLIPNGRNADGTLNNTAVDFASVATYTFPNAETGNYLPVAIFNTGITYYSSTYTFFGGSRPSTTTNWTRWYNEKDNVWELYNNGWDVTSDCVIGFATVSSGVIQSLNVKSTFNSLDRGDIEFILQQSFPSNTYVDATPGASGTTYTFGANGWLCIGFQHPDDSNWVNYGVDILDADGTFIWNIQGTRALNNQTDGVVVPVNKNQKVRIYNNSYVINRLRFVYAVGEV